MVEPVAKVETEVMLEQIQCMHEKMVAYFVQQIDEINMRQIVFVGHYHLLLVVLILVIQMYQ